MGQVRNPRVGHEQVTPGGMTVIKGDGQLRKMRCPRCKELASQVRRADGKMVYRCNCGNEMSCTKM